MPVEVWLAAQKNALVPFIEGLLCAGAQSAVLVHTVLTVTCQVGVIISPSQVKEERC